MGQLPIWVMVADIEKRNEPGAGLGAWVCAGTPRRMGVGNGAHVPIIITYLMC